MVDWSQGLQGAGGGAMAGGAVGGPWGAAIGGALGLAGGLFGGGGKQGYQDQLNALAAGYGKRTAPQMGAAGQAGYSDFRRNQAGLITQLEMMARGQGPSAATMQMHDAMDRAAGAQASAAAGAGGRGVNAGAALRNATNNTAAIDAQGARDTGTLRAQEQLNAIGALGQNISAGRSADESTNQFNVGQRNDMARANLEAKLRTMGINDQSQLQAIMGAMGAQPTGMGTSILAGGAAAVPGLLQYGRGNPNKSGSPAPDGGGGGYSVPGGYSPGYDGRTTPNGNGLGSGQQNPWDGWY